MNTSNNNLIEIILEKIGLIRDFIMDHLRVVLPVAVALIALIVTVVSVSAHNKKARSEAAQDVTADAPVVESLVGVDSSVVSVPEVTLEEDAHPEVNELIHNYFYAMTKGDVEALRKFNNNIDDTEAIRIQETSKYVRSYDNIKVYTKIGPVEGTYLAYVYYEEKFEDYDAGIPGLEAFYICTDDSGKLYINDGEESESVINYIREASLQDDVVDLNNEVASSYNNMLAENEDLSVFLVDLTESIDTAVGESLAQAEGEVTDTPATEEETGDAGAGESQTAEVTTSVVQSVRATTTVNIRSSDSETADKLGKASEGQEFKLIEERGNGWSEIEYNGASAFIKTEYLEKLGDEVLISVNGDSDTADNGQTNTQTANAATTNTNTATANSTGTSTGGKTSGKVMVKENVRIRSTPSTDGDKVGTAYMGQKLDLVEKMNNGWTKIKYEGEIAYVKSDYVE